VQAWRGGRAAEHRSEQYCFIVKITSAVRNSLFDLPAIASRSGEAGGHSIFKMQNWEYLFVRNVKVLKLAN
jgi:hypothetical protein